MTLENKVLSFLLNRNNYTRYGPYISKSIVTKAGKQIFTMIGDYFSKVDTECDDILQTDLISYFHMANSVWPKNSHDGMLTCLTELSNNSTLPPSLLEDLTEQSYADAVHTTAGEVLLGHDNFTSITSLIHDYETTISNLTNVNAGFVSDDIDVLLRSSSRTAGYAWSLPQFNTYLGPIHPTDLIIFGARPNAGKTSMLACEGLSILKQLPEDKNLLWVCNEEGGDRLKLRIISCAIDWEQEDIEADPATAKNLFESRYGPLARLKVYHKRHIPCSRVDQLIRTTNAGVAIFDQLRKFSLPGSKDPDYIRLQKLFEEARGMGIEHGIPILVVHQAGADAEGKKWLTQDMLHGSNTDIQGEADALIMIGRDHTVDNERYISIVKNKKTGIDANFGVKFKKETGRYG